MNNPIDINYLHKPSSHQQIRPNLEIESNEHRVYQIYPTLPESHVNLNILPSLANSPYCVHPPLPPIKKKKKEKVFFEHSQTPIEIVESKPTNVAKRLSRNKKKRCMLLTGLAVVFSCIIIGAVLAGVLLSRNKNKGGYFMRGRLFFKLNNSH